MLDAFAKAVRSGHPDAVVTVEGFTEGATGDAGRDNRRVALVIDSVGSQAPPSM